MEDDALQSQIDVITARLYRNEERLRSPTIPESVKIVIRQKVGEDNRTLREIMEHPSH